MIIWTPTELERNNMRPQEATESGLDLSCFLAFLMENMFRDKLKEEREGGRKWQKERKKDTRVLTFWVKKKCEREVMAPHFNAEQNTSDQVLFCFFQHGKKKKNFYWNFPGNPVVNTPHFQGRGTGLISSWGTKIPHATWHRQNKILPTLDVGDLGVIMEHVSPC